MELSLQRRRSGLCEQYSQKARHNPDADTVFPEPRLYVPDTYSDNPLDESRYVFSGIHSRFSGC